MATDPIAQIVTLLDTNWNAGNVAKPKIQRILDAGTQRRINLVKRDRVLIYEVSYTETPSDLNVNAIDRRAIYSIDIRTMRGRQRSLDLFDEVKRLCYASLKFPFTGTTWLIPRRRVDLSDRMHRQYRIVYDIELMAPYSTVTT